VISLFQEGEHMKMKLFALAIFYILSLLASVASTLAADSPPTKLKLRETEKSTFGNIKTTTDSVTGMEFVSVKGGCYQMGSTTGGTEEKPVHQVCLSDFHMGKYEVTQGQWEKVMGSNPSHFKQCGPECPVETVFWNDAQEFIKKLNSGSGKQYRLPTEAEWEYAARSGGKDEKWAGTSDETILGKYAWYDNNSGKTTHKAGLKKANGLGLHDMSGNVWEWCQDWYSDSYYDDSPKNNPSGPANGELRVMRGGSWNSYGSVARAAFRGRFDPGGRSFNVGFRLVLPAK
jgi:formylglycine-generating enzyme required for sulfatase activity